MPRRKRTETIPPTSLAEVERLERLLQNQISDATSQIRPYAADYNTLLALRRDLRRAVNILNGRAPDFVEPHRAPMSG